MERVSNRLHDSGWQDDTPCPWPDRKEEADPKGKNRRAPQANPNGDNDSIYRIFKCGLCPQEAENALPNSRCTGRNQAPAHQDADHKSSSAF
jgi:hypothetical protein